MNYNRQKAISDFLLTVENMLKAAMEIKEFDMNFKITTESSNEPEIRRDREHMHAEISYLFNKYDSKNM